jgi:hypothetical protein
MLWQYDKQLDSFTRVPVDGAANERHYYSADVEAALANEIEGPTNTVLDKLRRGETIDEDDRLRLTLYIATMLKRVPRFREWALGLARQVLPESVQRVKNFIRQPALEGYIDSSTETLRLAEAEAVEAKYLKCPPPEVLDKIRTPWATAEMVYLIGGMTWRLFSTEGPSFFLTSDNPAFFFSCYGLASRDVEIVFPISSELALHASWQPGVQNGVPVAEERLVREFNRRVASAATRFVYYREYRKWIASVAKTPPEALNRIRWQ